MKKHDWMERFYWYHPQLLTVETQKKTTPSYMYWTELKRTAGWKQSFRGKAHLQHFTLKQEREVWCHVETAVCDIFLFMLLRTMWINLTGSHVLTGLMFNKANAGRLKYAPISSWSHHASSLTSTIGQNTSQYWSLELSMYTALHVFGQKPTVWCLRAIITFAHEMTQWLWG